MRVRILIVLLVLAGSACAQAVRPVVVRPELKSVVLYLNRAELTHQGSVTLPAGTSTVLVRGLSGRAAEETVEVRFGAGAELVAVGGDVDGLAPAPVNKPAEDSLLRAVAEREKVKAELAALQEERQFWLANRTLPAGTQTGWSAELQKGAALLRTRLVANQLEINRLTALESLMAQQTARLSDRLERNDAPEKQDLVLIVRAAQSTTVPLSVHYFTTHSEQLMFWEPLLDIRSNDAARELDFVKRGRIYNLTMLSWQRVRLTLVDQQLASEVQRPTLQPWTLGFGGVDNQGEGRIDAFVVKGTAKGRPTEKAQSNRYELPEPVSLESKARRTLTLSAVTLPGRPEYLAVPKLTEKVFRQTKVTGWEGLQLPEEAEVYYRGAYVGSTELDAEAYNDSLELSLGFDDRLIVNRAKLKDVSGKAGLSGNRRVELLYELNVRNLHAEPVRVRVLDQLPIASDNAIEVKVTETSGAQLDERTGKLTWVLNMGANSSQKLRFGFEVEYPKDRPVDIIKHRRRISMPKTR